MTIGHKTTSGRAARACIFAAMAMAFCLSARGEDFKKTQGFMDIEVRGGLGRNWSYFFNHQSKVQDEDPAYFLWHLKGGIRYKPVSWLQLAVDHRYQEYRIRDEWLRESRSTFEATPRIKLGKWKLSSRNRMEYRDFDSPIPDRWCYRNQLKAEHPLPFWSLAAYVSEEPQYDFKKERWHKHRITAGLSRKVCSWLSAKLYYRWDVIEQSKNHGEWDTIQIFGIKLVTDLDRLVGKK